jgi:hypothetical protein
LEGSGVGADRDRTGITRGVEMDGIVRLITRPINISKTNVWRKYGREDTTRVMGSI